MRDGSCGFLLIEPIVTQKHVKVGQFLFIKYCKDKTKKNEKKSHRVYVPSSSAPARNNILPVRDEFDAVWSDLSLVNPRSASGKSLSDTVGKFILLTSISDDCTVHGGC